MTVDARPALRASDRLALLIATGGGAGYLPIAPGTWGSGVVVVAVYALYAGGVSGFAGPVACAALVGAALVLAWAGVWAGGRASALSGDDDPSLVVIDEVVGQLLTYSLLPVAGRAWGGWSFEIFLAAGFLLFRALDIVKPGSIDDLQRLHGGLGIMAYDFLAGVVGGWIMLVAAILI